jgi:hypothetical protein
MLAAALSPPGNTTLTSPSSGNASSEVTTSPARHTNPDARIRGAWTPTTRDAAPAISDSNADEMSATLLGMLPPLRIAADVGRNWRSVH